MASDRARFVADTAAAFDRAHASVPSADWWLRIAGSSVRVRVAGTQLSRRFRPALATVEATPEPDPVLSVGIWDRGETETDPPPPAWAIDDFLPDGRIKGAGDGGVRVTYDRWLRVLSVHDGSRGEAWVAIAEASKLPAWVDRAPLRSIFGWWAADMGLAFLHASAVADADRGVVLAGPSGSGKSTTAMACLADDMRFIGDDACVVRPDDEPSVFPVYGVAKLEPDAVGRIPGLERLGLGECAGPIQVDKDLVATRASLRAVLLPELGDADCRLAPVARAKALRTLVSSCLPESSGASGPALRALVELVRRVPCYRLELGRDIAAAVAAVRRALEQP